MASLEKDMSEIIRKNLPEHLSKELQERLALVDKLEAEVKLLKVKESSLNSLLQERETDLSKLRKNESHIESETVRLKVLEKSLLEREKSVDLINLERDLTGKFKDELKEILHLAFKNPVVNAYKSKTINDNSSGYAPNGSTSNNRNLIESESHTISQE